MGCRVTRWMDEVQMRAVIITAEACTHPAAGLCCLITDISIIADQ